MITGTLIWGSLGSWLFYMINGNLRPIQVILLVVSLPILLVGVMMSTALVKTLKSDHALKAT